MSKSIDDILRQQAVYLDWNLNGVADLPSDPSGGGGDTDPLRFEVI